MPSSNLKKISQQINASKADNFSKFYMYAALLKTIIATENLDFFDYLPGLNSEKVDDGQLEHVSFNNLINDYKKDLAPEPHWSNPVTGIFYMYFGSASFNDMLFIFEQMSKNLEELDKLENTDGLNQINKNIYTDIKFKEQLGELQKSINAQARFYGDLISVVNSTINSILLWNLALIAITIMLAFTLSWLSLAIGAVVILASGFGIFANLQHLRSLFNLYTLPPKSDLGKNPINNFLESTEETIASCAYNTLSGDQNHLNFVIKSVTVPLYCAMFKAAEQFSPIDTVSEMIKGISSVVPEMENQIGNMAAGMMGEGGLPGGMDFKSMLQAIDDDSLKAMLQNPDIKNSLESMGINVDTPEDLQQFKNTLNNMDENALKTMLQNIGINNLGKTMGGGIDIKTEIANKIAEAMPIKKDYDFSAVPTMLQEYTQSMYNGMMGGGA
jgi:hypothetical protein